MTVELISEADFDEKIDQTAQPVVVDFWLADCPPCQTLEPKLEAVAEEFAGQVQVYRLDIEESPSIPERYGVMSIPTLVFFKDGAAVERLDGLITRADLEAAFDEVSAA